MTLDPRGPMRPGQPLSLSAAQLNWINQQMRGPGMGGGALGNYAPAPFSRIKLRWTAQDADRVLKPWSFIVLNGSIKFFPESTDEYWDGVPLYDATADNAQVAGKFSRVGVAVPLEPIGNNSIGWAAICGAVPVRVDIKNAFDAHAMPFVRRYTSSGTAVATPYTPETEGEWRLQSFPFAGYKIISCASEYPGLTEPADDVWALIDLSSFWAQPLVLGRVEDNGFAVSGSHRTYLVRLYISNGHNPIATDYYVGATTYTLRQGVIQAGTYTWIANPYLTHLYAIPNVEPPWEIVAVEHEQWGVSNSGVPTNLFRAGQTIMLPKP